MIPALAPLALTASTGALLALPLTPAFRELKSKRDAKPLVTRKDDGRPGNFAASLRSRCNVLQSVLDADATDFVDCADTRIFISSNSGSWRGPRKIDVLVICKGPSQLPEGFQSTENFYALHTIDVGENSLFRALLGEQSIVLGDGARILRWIHAESNLTAGKHCCLFGRASSNRSLTLSSGCRFERMHAPVIYTSSNAMGIVLQTESAPFSKLARAGIGRIRFQGKTKLTAGQQHRGDLIVTNSLVMEDDSSVLGSVKANAEVSVGTRVAIDGSLISTKAIHIAPGAFIKGPLISEQEIVLAENVQIGLPETLTTVSAPRIRLSQGSVIHGTVWARREGRVGD